ncbi:MAG: phospholipase D family protein [Gammaproteobacteria bacterium]|nr:phospholipase D family protein [Gammaproteobacteria bacterium]MXW44879.1 hypothetical protein [Gammaproteobacteria bacterium]
MRLVTNIVEEFRKNLEWATRIDIASAWATRTESLSALVQEVERRGISVRAIVGISGRATDPDALRLLQEAGELRIADDPPLFHPKFYHFQGQAKAVAWIGSANFTAAGGFGQRGEQHAPQNTETLFETRDVAAAAEWFEAEWKEHEEVCREQLEKYRQERKKRPPEPSIKRIVHAPNIGPDARSVFLDEAKDWGGYVRALEECDTWWKHQRRCKFSVLGETDSWVHTIARLRPLAESRDWSKLEAQECKKLLGLIGGEGGWALLGNMRGAGTACSSFEKDSVLRRRIGEIVERVVNAKDHEFPEYAVKAVNAVEELDGYSIGIATRLLAIARPDRCVSLNGQSRRLLVARFPNVGRLSTTGGYGRLLQQVYRQPWYHASEPEDQCELEWWGMRAALLDCFVYERSGT